MATRMRSPSRIRSWSAMARPTSRKSCRSSSIAGAHATLKAGLGPRMSRRARVLTARAARTWLGAAGGSIAVHVIALVALIRGAAADVAPGPWQLAPPSPADSIDVVSLDDPAVRQPPPATAPEIPSPGHDAPEADQARWAALAVAPRVADGRTPAPPAPDSGQRAGRVSDGVWRRDRSTLHEQLTDGANAYQIARTH